MLKIKELSKAHVFFRVGRDETLWNWGTKTYRFLLDHAYKTANFSSSNLDFCFVGAGRIEACLYGNVTVIDAAAAIGFVKEAGGLVVGLDGVEITDLSIRNQTILATNNAEILSEIKIGITM